MSSSKSSFINSSTVDRFVERIPWRYWCRCPIDVWMDLGRCLRTAVAVKSGKVVRRLFLMALINVATVGPHNDAWWYACNSAVVRCWYALYAKWFSWFLLLLIGIGTSQRLVSRHLGPSMIVLLFLMTVKLSFPKVQKQSASQSIGIDSRFFFILVKTWAFFAVVGRCLISTFFFLRRLHFIIVCTDDIKRFMFHFFSWVILTEEVSSCCCIWMGTNGFILYYCCITYTLLNCTWRKFTFCII